jgi:hypothetical protein
VPGRQLTALVRGKHFGLSQNTIRLKEFLLALALKIARLADGVSLSFDDAEGHGEIWFSELGQRFLTLILHVFDADSKFSNEKGVAREGTSVPQNWMIQF